MNMGLRVWAVVAILALAPAASWAVEGGAPAEFIDGMVGEAIHTLRDPTLADAQRGARLGTLLTRDFDIPRVARFVLGRYWRTASEDERRDFARLFQQWVVRTYTARLEHYSNETVRVTGARPEGDSDAVVSSEIVHSSGPPTRVAWQVSRRNGAWRVVDVDVEGVSMALTERDEIAATIERAGGTVAALNRTLGAKLAVDPDAGERASR